MLPKKNRIDKKGIDLLFKEGRFIASNSFTFRFILQKLSFPRLSVIVPKSVAKLAVKRNSLRRKGYAVLGKYISHFPPGLLGAFVFKKYQEDISKLENEIKNILNKIN